MIYNALNLLLLLGFCLFCSVLVFVINFVLGFAVQLAFISTKLPSSVAYVGSQLVSSKDGNFLHVFFYLHHLLCYFGRHYPGSFVLGLQSNFRPALQSAKRLIPIYIYIYFDFYFSAPAAPWVLSRGGGTWCLLV
jgi:hypothetical protein